MRRSAACTSRESSPLGLGATDLLAKGVPITAITDGLTELQLTHRFALQNNVL
jgi:hypothetical protein